MDYCVFAVIKLFYKCWHFFEVLRNYSDNPVSHFTGGFSQWCELGSWAVKFWFSCVFCVGSETLLFPEFTLTVFAFQGSWQSLMFTPVCSCFFHVVFWRLGHQSVLVLKLKSWCRTCLLLTCIWVHFTTHLRTQGQKKILHSSDMAFENKLYNMLLIKFCPSKRSWVHKYTVIIFLY